MLYQHLLLPCVAHFGRIKRSVQLKEQGYTILLVHPFACFLAPFTDLKTKQSTKASLSGPAFLYIHGCLILNTTNIIDHGFKTVVGRFCAVYLGTICIQDFLIECTLQYLICQTVFSLK